MLYIRGVFTQEANTEADQLVFSKRNFLNAKGELTRAPSKIGKECVLGLYELTKDI